MKVSSAFYPLMSCLLLFAAILFSNELYAQQSERIHIQGVVRDKQTKQALPFANIYVVGKGLGGTTNHNGVFTFKVPAELLEDTLRITFMGYNSYSAPVKELQGKQVEIELEPTALMMREAVVEPWDARKILEQAIENIPRNYWSEQAVMTFFYRGKTRSNEEYIEYSEGVFKLHRDEKDSQLELVKGRQSICEAIFDQMKIDLTLKGSYFKNADLVNKREETDILTKEGFKNHDFWVDGITTLGDCEVYKISFEQNDRSKRKAYFEGTIYVQTESKAIIRIDFGYDTKYIRNAKVWTGSSKLMAMFLGISADIENMRRRVDYRKYEGKWILDKSIHHFSYNYQKESPLIRSLLQVDAEYLVTEVAIRESTEMPQDDIGKRENVLQAFSEFSHDFWEEYNIIEESDQIHHILRDIEQQKKLYEREEVDKPSESE